MRLISCVCHPLIFWTYLPNTGWFIKNSHALKQAHCPLEDNEPGLKMCIFSLLAEAKLYYTEISI